MEKYELMYILPSKYTEEELTQQSAKIRDIVVNAGGQVAEEHSMGKRKLAYPIKHVRYGHYYLTIFTADEASVAKLNTTLRMTSDLLRHLIVIRDPFLVGVPKLREEESIVMKRERKEAVPRRRPLQQERLSRPRPAEGKATDSQADDTGKGGADAKDKMTIEDLDRKLDKILTDEIL